jgi:putative PIN family toxin of toxin-antitoxin system
VRVVLDTNVVVSAIVFREGRLSWLRELWRESRIVPLASRATTDELIRVLAYPKFRLSQDDIQALLSEYLPFAEPAEVGRRRAPGLPRCSDPDDEKFLALAVIGNAEALVTGDKALLILAGRTRFAIESPAVFRRRFPAR